MAAPTPPYTNDPLRWVAADVRFPPMEALSSAVPDAFREHVHERFPVVEPVAQLSLTLSVPGAPAPPSQQVTLQRMLQRDRLMAITIGRDGLTLETSDYPGWTDFRAVLKEMLGNLQEASRPDGVLRVGLRYIDEIRLATAPETPAGWAGWIDSRLLGPLTLADDRSPSEANTILQYGIPPGYVTVFRASPLASGRAVNPDGPLRMPVVTPAGPYFLLDTDASWADPERQIPQFEADNIAAIFDELHGSFHQLFEASITDDLREFLRRDRAEVWGEA